MTNDQHVNTDSPASPVGLEAIHADLRAWHQALLQPGSGAIFRLSHPAANPVTGEIVVCGYTVEAIDQKPVARLYRFDTDDKTLVPALDHDGEQIGPRFGPDGSMIAFRLRALDEDGFAPAVVDKTGHVRTFAPLDGSVEQLEWSTDGSTLIALVADEGAPLASTQGAIASTKTRDDVPAWYPRIDDGETPPRRHIVLLPMDGSKARKVPTRVNVWEFCTAGPGSIAAVATEDPAENAWYGSKLSLIDLESGEDRPLHIPSQQISALSATTDGSRIAFAEGLASDRGLLAGDLFLIDVATAQVSAAKTPDVDIGWTGWRGDQLLAAGIRSDDILLLKLDPGLPEIQPVYVRHAVSGGRHYPIPAVLPGDPLRAAFAMHAVAMPDALVIVSGAGEEQLWSAGSETLEALVRAYGPERYQPISWRAPDGELIDGWLHVPEGQGPFPLVTIVHGYCAAIRMRQ
jgi:dipeptidyl aminopeptidase/acylaminoacyl peptidase